MTTEGTSLEEYIPSALSKPAPINRMSSETTLPIEQPVETSPTKPSPEPSTTTSLTIVVPDAPAEVLPHSEESSLPPCEASPASPNQPTPTSDDMPSVSSPSPSPISPIKNTPTKVTPSRTSVPDWRREALEEMAVQEQVQRTHAPGSNRSHNGKRRSHGGKGRRGGGA